MTNLIFITGIDGSGKSYFAGELVRHLESQHIPVKHVWARFMNYTSKPLLGLCRVLKLSYRENHGGVIVGYHDFEKSSIVSMLFVLLQLIDIKIVVLFKILLPIWFGKVVICERGPYDTFIDLMVDIKKTWPCRPLFRKLFFYLLPKEHVVLYLQRKKEDILLLRPDVGLDKNFDFRNALYAKCADIFKWDVIDNNGTKEDTLITVYKQLGLND